MRAPAAGNALRIDAFGFSLCALITALLHVGAVAPVLRGNQGEAQLRTVLSEKEREAALADADRRARQADLRIVESRAEQGKLQLLPQSARLSRLAELNSAAVEAGLTIDQITPGKSIETVPFIAVPIRLVGSGSFDASARFLAAVHEEFADVKVRSLRLTAATDNPAKSAFEFDLVWHADRDGSVVAAPTP